MDFHKRRATADLWNNNGDSTVKKYRYKGKARESEKRLIRQELADLAAAADEWLEELRYEEIEEALYCHYYGPCRNCVSTIQQLESQEESKNTS